MARHRSIPPNAKLAFEGILFEVWQWPQKMFDGSTETFERLKRSDTAQIVAAVGDKIIVLKQEQPDSTGAFPSIPGGRIDESEDALAGARRELLEETGYSSEDWELWFAVEPVNKIEWTVHTFIARNCRKVAEPKLDAGERITQKLVTFEEFLNLPDNERFYDKEISEKLLRARTDYVERRRLYELIFKTEHA